MTFKVFNGSPMEDFLSSAIAGTAWKKSLDKFYKTKSDSADEQNLELVLDAGTKKAMRLVLDMHTRQVFRVGRGAKGIRSSISSAFKRAFESPTGTSK